jgi:hypothetical protein
MTDFHSSLPGRQANGQFAHGNPGRRAGSRNRASHRVVMAILEDFEQNKIDVLERLRYMHTTSYFSTLARLAPPLMESGEPDAETWSDAEAAQIIARARQMLACQPNPRNALVELEAILANEPAE